MRIKYSKVKNISKNFATRTSASSLTSIEGVMLNNMKASLLFPFLKEDNDEEWLKAKHRMLDDRIELRNRMKTIRNIKTKDQNNINTINKLNVLFD